MQILEDTERLTLDCWRLLEDFEAGGDSAELTKGAQSIIAKLDARRETRRF